MSRTGSLFFAALGDVPRSSRRAPDGVAALQSRQWQRAERTALSPVEGLSLPRRRRERATAPARRVLRRSSPSRDPVRFGGVVAVDGVSFDVEPGEVVGLIGPNGAGKTTILDVVTGFTTPASGSVRFDGRSDRPLVGGAAGPRRHRAVVAGRRAVRGDDRAREPARRRGRPVAVAATSPICSGPGGRRRPRSCNEVVEELELGDVLDVRPSVAVARRRAPRRHRPRARDRTGRAPARRARRGARHQRSRPSSATRSVRVAARRGHRRARRRARRATDPADLRPHRRARLRAHDRRGHARRDQPRRRASSRRTSAPHD